MTKKSAELQLVALHLGRRRSAVPRVPEVVRYLCFFLLVRLAFLLLDRCFRVGLTSTVGVRGFNRFPTANSTRDRRTTRSLQMLVWFFDEKVGSHRRGVSFLSLMKTIHSVAN